jgi:hypothetical protein
MALEFRLFGDLALRRDSRLALIHQLTEAEPLKERYT